MTAAAVAPLTGGDPLRYATLAAGLAIAVGVLCLLARVAQAGALADLLSTPVLVGYLAGIAVIMIVSQLGKLTGIPVEGDSVPAEIASFVTSLGRLHAPTAALSALLLLVVVVVVVVVVLVVLVGWWLRPNWPVPLIGMLAATGAVAVFSLQQHGIVVIGQAAIGIPAPGVPAVSAADLGALASR